MILGRVPRVRASTQYIHKIKLGQFIEMLFPPAEKKRGISPGQKTCERLSREGKSELIGKTYFSGCNVSVMMYGEDSLPSKWQTGEISITT